MKHQTQIDRDCGSGLEIHRGRTGQRFRPIVDGRLVLGSAPECDLRLGGTRMPAVHSQVHLDDGRAWIESVAADPPLLVNGEPCDNVSLADGDVIVVGPFAFTWRAAEEDSPEAIPETDGFSVTDLVDRLERDMALVAESDEATRRAAATVVEAALETIYGSGVRLRAEVGDRDDLGTKLDELTRRIEAQETAYAEAISSLLDTQERLVAQVESLVARVVDEQSDDEGLRASA